MHKLRISAKKELSTSVNLEEFQIKSTYNGSLREFLKPSINENKIAKLKCGKN